MSSLPNSKPFRTIYSTAQMKENMRIRTKFNCFKCKQATLMYQYRLDQIYANTDKFLCNCCYATTYCISSTDKYKTV
jgi:hypothetical protein